LSDRLFITKWGSQGSGDGEFWGPYGIAVDGSGNVYVTDRYKNDIQKFTSDGAFVTQWGSRGTGDGQFNWPDGIAIDRSDNVYVVDRSNNRIQKFTSDGKFITKWGSYGYEGDGEFDWPTGITLDDGDNVYVVDYGIYNVQKFTSDGEFITKWGSHGQFGWPKGIAVDRSGNVYVTDRANHHIQKFTLDGEFITKWESFGEGAGQFNGPSGIATLVNGKVYVTDKVNNRIQEFTADGQLITNWGSQGTGDGEFWEPEGIATDESGNVYVVDFNNNRIQKFTPDGKFITKWGNKGHGDGQFDGLSGIALDGGGNVYVADGLNHRIQKFTSEGVFLIKWGSWGAGDGEFNWPTGIAVDGSGNIYVADDGNDRIQKFTPDGKFITKWGRSGFDEGEFAGPVGIAIDRNGMVYVADAGNDRIQIFASDGDYLATLGTSGSGPGMLNEPYFLDLDVSGRIYVTDRANNRIQVFKPVSVSSNNKAIIVSGGGPYAGNSLWDATQMAANFAYRTLTHQGFTKETIYYLSPDTDLDLDSNGVPDDVDGDASNENLLHTITTWTLAEPAAENLVIYLVDHGGDKSFRMNGTETLSATELNGWLNELQSKLPCKVIVIYEACESGSFVDVLKRQAGERVVITSTSEGEAAHFITHGSISFSSYFWTHIFNGADIKDAFELARDSISYTTDYQLALLDADGDGIGNEPEEDFNLVQGVYIGNGTLIHGDAPVIADVSPDRNIVDTNTAVLEALNVTDDDGIARVWAVIRPPDYQQGPSSNPVQDLPTIDLRSPKEEPDNYQGTYDAFNIDGTYQIAIYARDRIGNTSVPVLTTVSVNNPKARRAIIVAGGTQSDVLWPAVETNVNLAFEALRFQGYSDDDIYLMSPASIPGVTATSVLPTLSSLTYAIETWAAQNTRDLVLYLIGPGDTGIFYINSTETLSPTALSTWLDNLQSSMPGTVTVIYDGCKSGSFLSSLVPPEDKERIVIASTRTDQPAHFNIESGISFSQFFWQWVLDGSNVGRAFKNAQSAIRLTGNRQTAQLDDNGNGIGNDRTDFQLAGKYIIGVGIMQAADAPLIETIRDPQTLPPGTSEASIWVENVTTTGTLDRVYAEINPPGNNYIGCGQSITEVAVVDLVDTGSGRYEATYDNFGIFGKYSIVVYAKDTEGNISTPKETYVELLDGSDTYEPGEPDELEYPDNAQVIIVNDKPQYHNFHESGDQDWVQFYGITGVIYDIKTSNLGTACDTVISLYDASGTLVDIMNANGAGEDEELNWQCIRDGVYYVMVRHSDESIFGDHTGYDLSVSDPTLPDILVLVTGRITDAATGKPIQGAKVRTDSWGSAISLYDGNFIMLHPAGDFTFTVFAVDYASAIRSGVAIPEVLSTTIGAFALMPAEAGEDSDGDGILDRLDNCPHTYNPDQTDGDTDGYGDGCDVFPDDPQEGLDTDGDGIGNNADPDDDNDGMPDEWEVTYGLNPVVDDADDDMDGDGLSNIEEYWAGGHPNNTEPDKPHLVSPWDGEPEVSLALTFETGAFSDHDGDNHAKTEWQISSASDDFSNQLLVLSVTSDSRLTFLKVAEFILEVKTIYFWRARFYDSRNAVSEWSDAFSFTTLMSNNMDADGDGVPDDQEIVDPLVDLDGDGISDIEQNTIKCVNTAVGSGQVGLKFETLPYAISAIKSIDPVDIPDLLIRPEELPFGLISFKIKVDNMGDAAEVTAYFSKPLPSEARWYKYDPLHGWRWYPHATFNAARNGVTLQLKDGDLEYGDIDGVANSIILDPGGVGVLSTGFSDSDGGDVGSCFIDTAAFGSRMVEQVRGSDKFRDHILLTNSVGRRFVNHCYCVFPKIFDSISHHDSLYEVVHWSFLPLKGATWMVLTLGPLAMLSIAAVLIVLIVGHKRSLL